MEVFLALICHSLRRLSLNGLLIETLNGWQMFSWLDHWNYCLSLSVPNYCFEDFDKLLCITFSQLQSLVFGQQCPRNELLIKFLENGRNLKEFYICENDDSLNLAIIKSYPNIRNHYTGLILIM